MPLKDYILELYSAYQKTKYWFQTISYQIKIAFKIAKNHAKS